MTTTQEHNPQVSAHPDDAARVPQVEQVLKALVKFIGGRRLYARNNPRLGQFQHEFRAALQAFFTGEPELILTVDQYDILWHGHVVYSNDKREDSLAFVLYKDGVGEVTISEGALESELDVFVGIITEESGAAASASSDEDVVTKLWNADFDHISYRVVDDYLASEQKMRDETDEPVEVADQPELRPSLEDRGRVIVRPNDPIESIDGYLRRQIMTNCESSDEVEREAYFQDMVASFFSDGDGERERYHAERDRELRDDGLAAFAEAILVFTLLPENPSAVRDVSDVLERIVDHVIVDRDTRALVRLITVLRGFRADQSLPEGIVTLCERLERKMTEPALVQSFEAELEQWSANTEYVLAYFKCIGNPVVEPLLKLLHHVDGGRLHREVCMVLIDAAGDDIESVLDRMDIDNINVARDAVFIASRIELESITPRVQELLSYPDKKIKSDMLELVSAIDDPSVPDLLMNAATDADKEIRCRALLVAAGRGLPAVAKHLDDVAFGKGLQDLDEDEQEAVFKALGIIGGADTVERLRRFISKRRLMDFSRNRDSKLLAIRALEYIQERSSVDLLQNLEGDSNDVVKARATRALSALRARMRSGNREEDA